VYQPIVTLAEVTVVGHEALVRWAHPTRGLFGPAREFLEVAEEGAGAQQGGGSHRS